MTFVSASGSDSNSGLNPESPKLTLQAAVDAASPNGTVYADASTFTLTSPLVMRPGVQLVGSNTVIKQGAGANLHPLVDFDTGAAHGSSMRGCIVDQNRDNNEEYPNRNGVYIGSANDVVLEWNKFRNMVGTGVNVSNGRRPIVCHNDFQNINCIALAVSTIGGAVVTNGLFAFNTFWENLGQHVIVVKKSHGNQILNNRIEGVQRRGVCNVSGTTVTRVSGADFAGLKPGGFCIMSPGGNFTEGYVVGVPSSNVLTLNAAATSASGVEFIVGTGDMINIGNSWRTRIAGNELYYGASGAIVIHNFEGGNYLQHTTIENNNIYYAGGSGVGVQSVANGTLSCDTTIRNNTIISCGMGGAAVGVVGRNAIGLIDFQPTSLGSVMINGNRFQNEGGLPTMLTGIYQSGVSSGQVFAANNTSVSI
ncbi:right-handed parallel beta-helix repeat-containing protein [Bradyrhizobium sp.]|uniref:right-handed parallel beta-helix repeat-containing protein n=1 Tax=Bradyrhizobium sp. TaxID=376 RepID=UPI0025BA6007|nr:right-handed parallel beta-helix repeat-containing protein [Bradyrhizobium sp.]